MDNNRFLDLDLSFGTRNIKKYKSVCIQADIVLKIIWNGPANDVLAQSPSYRLYPTPRSFFEPTPCLEFVL